VAGVASGADRDALPRYKVELQLNLEIADARSDLGICHDSRTMVDVDDLSLAVELREVKLWRFSGPPHNEFRCSFRCPIEFGIISSMKEIARHTAGRIYLIALLLSIVGFIAFLVMGGTGADASGDPIIVLGWMTMPLVGGIVFVLFWLVTYLIYFFFFWPYR